jgi:outer membrane protein OmpA-like peptidoglycan-associated protein
VTNPTINVTGTTPALPVTIDLTAPSSSSTPDLNASSDTGYSTSDNITKDATPRIDVGSVAMGMTVTVIASRTGSPDVSCSYIASPSVTGCDLPALSDGTWSVISRVSDVAGNVSSNSSALSVVVDTATAVSNVSVLGGGSLVKGVLPDLLAESDSGSSSTDNVTSLQALSVSVANAQLNDVVTMVASRAGSPDIICAYRRSATVSSCVLQTLSFGNWKIKGTVTDTAGNSYETDSLPVTVSNIVGLPALDKAEISTKLNIRGSTTEVKISIPSNAGQVATRKFEVAVLNSAGVVIRTQSISLPAGTRSTSFTMPTSSGAARVMVYATNEFGVSNRARVGANVRHLRSNLICQGTGQSMYSESSLTERVVFSAASPLLDAQDKETLNKVAKFMANRGGQIVITGLARKNGIDSLKFLTNLSIERARNVAMYLSSKGVRAWINYEGFGAVSKEIGTPLDRRVDVCWTSQPLETK